MKKNGFTLSELLITLSIVAIASALIMPSVSKLMPDSYKLDVINAHTTIIDKVNGLLDNPQLYYCEPGQPFQGLACDLQVAGMDINFAGDTKFEYLMARALELEDADVVTDGFNWKDVDGRYWRFERTDGGAGANKNRTFYAITVDLNGTDNSKGPNSTFVANTVKKPDRFRFMVNNYGGVTPDDAMTAAYLRNSFKMNDRQKDRSTAARMYAEYPRYQIKG